MKHSGSIEPILAAIKDDPWSADLTLGAALWYAGHGDSANSRTYTLRFIAIAPSDPLAQRLVSALK